MPLPGAVISPVATYPYYGDPNKAERERLAFEKAKWERILGLFQNQFGKTTQSTVPDAYKYMVDLYQPGGQYGEGGRAEIQRGANESLAAGQIGLTQTGMSSGTNVAGLRARVAADAALARQKIEDQRIQLLGSSLGQLGQAGLTTQQLNAQQRAQLMQTLASFQ